MFDLTTYKGVRTTTHIANMAEIRKAEESDKPAIWHIIKAVIGSGDTYVFAPDATEDEMMSYWFTPEKHNYVAILEGGELARTGSAQTIPASAPTWETALTWSHQMRKDEA